MAPMKKKRINFKTPIGTAKYPHLNRPDTAFDAEGKYKTEIVLSSKAARPLIDLIESSFEAEYGKGHHRVPYKVDEETGDVSFKAQSKYQPKFADSTGQMVPPEKLPNIGGGSRLCVSGFLNVYDVSGTKGVSITLQDVQIVEATMGVGGGNFEAVDGGFTMDAAMDTMEAAANDNDFDF